MRSLIQVNEKIILGSSSPRRQEMLRQLGLDFEVCKPETEESRVKGELPEDYVARNCQEKAHWVRSQQKGDGIIISADTIVVDGQQVLEKPKDPEDAAAMLRHLSGRRHQVMSAFCLLHCIDGKVQEYRHTEVTQVEFVNLSQEDIDFYVATGEPLDKAGAYGIQGIGGFLVKAIDGSYSNVVGLPLTALIEVLKSL